MILVILLLSEPRCIDVWYEELDCQYLWSLVCVGFQKLYMPETNNTHQTYACGCFWVVILSAGSIFYIAEFSAHVSTCYYACMIVN